MALKKIGLYIKKKEYIQKEKKKRNCIIQLNQWIFTPSCSPGPSPFNVRLLVYQNSLEDSIKLIPKHKRMEKSEDFMYFFHKNCKSKHNPLQMG